MGRLRRTGAFLISKPVAIAILGFLLSLFGREILYAIPSGKELEVAAALFFPILVLMIYVLGILDEAKEHWWKWRRFRTPITIGVLKGFLDDRKKGLECKPMYSTKKCWVNHFGSIFSGGKKLFSAKEIFWSEISSRYAAIIDPFGEIYLERDRRNFQTYEEIKKYLADGGIFCCTGGFPFYYFWDSVTGFPVDTTAKTRISSQAGIQDIRLFFDSLVTRDFGAAITNDPQSPTLARMYQEEKPDVEFFGNLSNVGGTDQALEFRSLSEESKGLIPGLRVKHKEEVKFPLAAISYGNGYLIVAGMDVKTEVEFKKLSMGIANFVIETARRNGTSIGSNIKMCKLQKTPLPSQSQTQNIQ